MRCTSELCIADAARAVARRGCGASSVKPHGSGRARHAMVRPICITCSLLLSTASEECRPATQDHECCSTCTRRSGRKRGRAPSASGRRCRPCASLPTAPRADGAWRSWSAVPACCGGGRRRTSGSGCRPVRVHFGGFPAPPGRPRHVPSQVAFTASKRFVRLMYSYHVD